MSSCSANRLLSLLVLLALVLQPVSSALAQAPTVADAPVAVDASAPAGPQGPGFLFRALIELDGSRTLARLEKTGVLVLRSFTEGEQQKALVLADAEQLAELARLGFRPQAADELRGLLRAQGKEKRWLTESLAPLLAQADALAAPDAAEAATGEAATPDAAALQTLRAGVKALTVEQMAGTANSVSVDDDADGLTNTQEAWWCTDPSDPDTDDDGRTDGAEINALKDWLGNKRESAPGETPWPNWPPQRTNCPDKDHDSIPNLAERWDLGLNMDLESSDRDKFDDGQELFGTTYCPGGDNNCGYGDLPRSSDAGYVGAQMPSWVKAPGKHPLVTAFPIPEVDVVESSLHVQVVEIVTTDHTIASGTEKSYSTAKMEGTSTSVADTTTWNSWEEASLTKPTSLASASSVNELTPGWKLTTEASSFLGTLGTIALCGTQSWACVASELLTIVGPEITLLDTLADQADQRQESTDQNTKLPCDPYNHSCPGDWSLEYSGNSSTSTDTTCQNMTTASGGTRYTQSAQPGQITTQPLVAAHFPASIGSTTTTHGTSHGGAHTMSTEQYEEHTVTNGEAFSSEESWSTATAVDSAHSADLWFSYKVRNTGTEYAREIADLAFNIYIGDDPNPVYTYFVAPDLGGDGKFHNFMPGEEHTYSARTNTHAVPLTLDQMRVVDLGGPIRIVVEDFTYGVDELFYQDAANAGVMLAMEDGTADGDESIDTYLAPTWGAETVLDVLARYFPHTTDADDNLTAIWTPEYRADTPTWCGAPSRTGNTLWCRHALSTADWWNVYTNGMGDGTEGFQDTAAAPGQVALFRFNQDSDLDGYSDRSEARLGTDPDDPASFPKPELLAGVHSIQNGNSVTATLSLLNTGVYDAYGVEAVMIAPDDTVSITNNTVGGSGRVRAQKSVIVGSRILPQEPLPSAWTQTGHAKPAAGGYYTGPNDRTYTFTVQNCPAGGCDVGAGSWVLHWDDGKGANGNLNFAANYKSPTFLDVGPLGVKLALYTGKVNNGESFTVAANTPRDTFQYTIASGHTSDYTRPIVLVSYNDPQGNHRFVIPPAAMALASPNADLMAFSGMMLADPGVEIVTDAAFTPGPTTTNLMVNNPTETTLTAAHLFLEFVDPNGTVVAEVPASATLPPGPSVVPVAWDSASFSPAYNPAQDYIVMAFLTDYQGNILDTAGRPLSSFQPDPKPALAIVTEDETWDFGTAQQGTLMQRQFTLASVGYGDLLTHLSNATGMSVAGPASKPLAPGDTAAYTVTLNTQSLPVGPYQQQLDVRTSDPAHPTKTITVRGNITPMPDDAPGGATIRPLDWTVNVPDGHNQVEWYEFAHTLGPDPQSLHPIKVYTPDYSKLWGVGKYATDFAQGTAAADMFGDGRDGPLTITTNGTDTPVDSACSGAANSYALSATNPGFAPGQVVLIHQTQGANAGAWMLNKIAAYATGTITLEDKLNANYGAGAQVLVLRQYTDVSVNAGTTWMVKAWNGSTGGILGFLANGVVTVNGTISANGGDGSYATNGNPAGGTGGGFRGGFGHVGSYPYNAQQGEGTAGAPGQSINPNGSGGGGGYLYNPDEEGGGGGGHAARGADGHGNNNSNAHVGYGGNPSGSADLNNMTLGGGGGGGCKDTPGNTAGGGGAGGGIILISAATFTNAGSISTRGGNSTNIHGAGGGGGAGGSIFVRARTAALGSGTITALGGYSIANNNPGGAGSVGRIHVEYCETLSGSTNPSADPTKLNCYMVEQAADPAHGRLNLPESGAHSYQVQYGRRYVFSGAGDQSQSIRMPKQLYSQAKLDALVSNTGVASGDLNLSIDVGGNGSNDWSYAATTTMPISFTVTSLTSAINDYMTKDTTKTWGADIDVPFKVTINRKADVILTNLILTLQSNQPGTAAAASVDLGADRPLDWTLNVPAGHNQGEWYEYVHTMQPDPQTLHPAKVFSQDYSRLWGVGKYATDFGQGTAPGDMFGNGSDGSLTISSDITDAPIDSSCTGTAGAYTLYATNAAFAPGQAILIHQTKATGAGTWMQNRIMAYAGGSITLAKPLNATYTAGAQVLVLRQYTDVNIQAGKTWRSKAWNGSTGGILGFLATGSVTVAGAINASARGYNQWGRGDYSGFGGPEAGEGYTGARTRPSPCETAYATDNGGTACTDGGGHTTGAGGGNGGYGGNGPWGDRGGWSSYGGLPAGSADLANMVFGGQGGGGSYTYGAHGGDGGYGGGIVFVAGASLTVSGAIVSNGARGGDGNYSGGWATPAGGGAGGSILLQAKTAALGPSVVTALGGGGGTRSGSPEPVTAGAGAVGRIHVDFCDNLSGTTNPGANTTKLSCYSVEQIESSPNDHGRLNLPESGAHTYQIQYARRYVFAGAGQDVKQLRVKRQMYGVAALDMLVSNTGTTSGAMDLCIDVGNDGTCDYHPTGSQTFPLTLSTSGLASAFNAYLTSRNDIAWGSPVDVPVRVQIDRKADVMLTNLALTPVGAKTRFLRLSAQNYDQVTLGVLFGTETTTDGPLSYTVDVGADGSVEWSGSGSVNFPVVVNSPNLAAAFNAYLAGKSGEVDVPIRITPSPSVETALDHFNAQATARPDASVTAGDITFDPADPTEGDPVTVTATIHNGGAGNTGRLTVSFFATTSGWGEWYIGSAFVPDVPAGGTAQAQIIWNTLGFTGTVPVRVVVDPYNRIAETNETNNTASASIVIKTRPDLRVASIALSDAEPMAGETVTAMITVRNSGQTAAGASRVALYDGNPDNGGLLLGESTLPVAAGADAPVNVTWKPTAAGPHQLFARVDAGRAVNEYDEGNNDSWRDVYVGFASPLLIDSGGGPSFDPAYTPELGFGYLNGDSNTFCGPDKTSSQRSGVTSNIVQYRFDHLLPGHFYHLDLVLFECDGMGRLEQVRVDDNVISEQVDLSDGTLHRLSFRLDPAFYADRGITVSIEELYGNDAVVSEINLHDIDYRYADAGAGSDLAYSAGRTYGWLDGVAQSTWGTLPFQTRRIDLADSDPSDDPDNELRYRYDHLDKNKKYQVWLKLYQGAGTATVKESISVDTVDTGQVLQVVGVAQDEKIVDVPVGMYSTDGTITVRIIRQGASANAWINEIALEELTLAPPDCTEVAVKQVIPLHSSATGPNWFSFNIKPPVQPPAACSGVSPTSLFTTLYGQPLLAGAPAPVGSIVEAFTPGGVKTGCFKVTEAGLYGYMRVYGAEGATAGMAAGDPIIVKINGIAATTTPYPLVWQDDKATREVNLDAPDVVPVETLLNPLTGKVTKLQCENGTYLPPPADPRFNTCTTVAAGGSYLLWMNTAANLTVSGCPVAQDKAIALHVGYNWLGYLPTCELTVANALQAIQGKYDIVHSEAGTYKPPPANPGLNNFNTLAPGRGYMIHMTEAATLTYPANLCGGALKSDAAPEAAAGSCAAQPTSRFTHYYGRVDAPAGSEVLAHSPSGQVVGCGRVGEDGLLPYLRVYGAEGNTPGMGDGEAVRFEVAGEPLEVQPAWRNDWNVHRLGQPENDSRTYLPLLLR